MEEDDNCITLLCSLPGSWDNLVLAIGSTTQLRLKFKNVVASLLSKDISRKYMEGVAKDVLSIRGRSQERKNRSSRAKLNLEEYLKIQDNIQENVRNLGIIRKIVDMKMLIKVRDLRMLLP